MIAVLDLAATVRTRVVDVDGFDLWIVEGGAGEKGADDAFAGFSELIPLVGAADEVGGELIEVIVDLAGVISADLVAEVGEPHGCWVHWIMGFPEGFE